MWEYLKLFTVDFSGEDGTSNVSLIWFSRSCWECEYWIWFQLFFFDCLGGKAGGGPSPGVSCDLDRKKGKEWIFWKLSSRSVILKTMVKQLRYLQCLGGDKL